MRIKSGGRSQVNILKVLKLVTLQGIKKRVYRNVESTLETSLKIIWNLLTSIVIIKIE